jgi:hypothetical protein
VGSGWVGDCEMRYVNSYTQVYQPSEDIAATGLCPDLTAAGCFENSEFLYRTVWRHIPDDSDIWDVICVNSNNQNRCYELGLKQLQIYFTLDLRSVLVFIHFLPVRNMRYVPRVMLPPVNVTTYHKVPLMLMWGLLPCSPTPIKAGYF